MDVEVQQTGRVIVAEVRQLIRPVADGNVAPGAYQDPSVPALYNLLNAP